MRSLARAVLPVVAALLLCSSVAGAARVPDRQITPLAASALAPPVPVKGSDGRWHLAYELQLHNWTGSPVTLEQVRVRGLPGGRVVARYATRPAVARLFQTVQFARLDPRAATIAGGQATLAWLSLDFARRSALPKVLDHELYVRGTGLDGRPHRFWISVARTPVSRRAAVRLGPPLRGAGYANANGCCEVAPHTRAIQTIDGARWLSQRFAIDWIKADVQGRTRNDGDPHDPASYNIYGQDVLAVADGRVVSILDGRPDQRPPAPDTTLTLENAARFVTGNHVILSIGHGRFPMYAHLQPGSIRVRLGQRVRRGQVLGLVGNSGNSSEPHLHFHVGSTTRPLEADGLPYVYDSFRVTDLIGGDRSDAFGKETGYSTRLTLDPVGGDQRHRDELPLIWDVVDFGG